MKISPEGNIARQIANAHTSFNVINTILFIPFTKQFTNLVKALMPGEEEEISLQPKYLNTEVLNTPVIAMSLATKEVVRMGELALDNIGKAMDCITNYDKKEIAYVLEHEPVIDNLEEAITVYLTKMSEKTMSNEMSSRHTGLLHVCSDIERIGDHAQVIAKKVRNMQEDGTNFSPQAQQEMKELGALVLTAATKAIHALETDNRELAEESLAVSHEVKLKQKAMRKSHVERLNQGICTPETGFVMLELLINMKRVSDHSKNISQLVLGEF